MKVRKTAEAKGVLPAPSIRGRSMGTGSGAAGFDRKVLEATLRQVVDLGERLGASLSWDDLTAYKEMVGCFLEAVFAGAFVLDKQVAQDRMGKSKIYIVVREVNRQLAELGEKLREGETARLEILARVDAIRGLLLDLYS